MRRGITTLCWSGVLGTSAWAAVRALGLERGPGVQLIAFTPYAAALAGLAFVLAAAGLAPLPVPRRRTGARVAGVLRRWAAAALAAGAVVTLGGCVLPRAVGSADPARGRPTLRVLTANLRLGGADPARLVDLVRRERVDVLVLQEFTAQARDGLAEQGLPAVLPYRNTAPVPGAGGSGLYSRFPLAGAGVRAMPSGFFQAYGMVRVPGAAPVLVESAHPCSPYSLAQLDCWWTDQAAEPAATAGGPARLLVGDFNATLDHVTIRRLLATGYRDAAAIVGAGLAGTWEGDRRPLVPPVVIDHVLVDRRVGVHTVSVYDVPGSDHRAVLAEVVLPGTP